MAPSRGTAVVITLDLDLFYALARTRLAQLLREIDKEADALQNLGWAVWVARGSSLAASV